jgi:hypothetical protein
VDYQFCQDVLLIYLSNGLLLIDFLNVKGEYRPLPSSPFPRFQGWRMNLLDFSFYSFEQKSGKVVVGFLNKSGMTKEKTGWVKDQGEDGQLVVWGKGAGQL